VADRLRADWDFDDLDGTEQRFRRLLAAESSDPKRAELLTQLARVQGLRGDFERGERLIEEAETLAAADDGAARVRIDLERGRLRRSSGDAKAALPLFESAFQAAQTMREAFLAADAAHMAALVAPDRDGFVSWTQRGVELAESDEDASYWLGPLLNNLGWELYEAGDYEGALETFQRSLEAREREPDNRAAIEIARYAVAKALRAVGRPEEAAPLLERAVAWAETGGEPDGWFHEELAETHAALGRRADAAEQAQRALALLPDADPSFEPNGQRAIRLRRLAERTNADSSR
jgi:tetratricopeptide (TPR) repeat protein